MILHNLGYMLILHRNITSCIREWLHDFTQFRLHVNLTQKPLLHVLESEYMILHNLGDILTTGNIT